MDSNADSTKKAGENPVYTSLLVDEIRVVSIFPGLVSDEILCGLCVLSLKEDPEYEALSYVWGDSILTQNITVNGHTRSATANLATALRHLRFEDKPRMMWIDAISINQADLAERNQQVSIMNAIYSMATATVIYLSDQSEDTDKAMNIILTLAEDQHLHRNPIFFGRFPQRPALADFEPLGRLMKLPWWRRVWVIQEVVLAKEIWLVCGKRALDWDEVVSLAAASVDKHCNTCCIPFSKSLGKELGLQIGSLLLDFRPNIINITRLRTAYKSGISLRFRDLVVGLRDKEATDRRDKVYGVLGLQKMTPSSNIKPDYALSISEAYANATLQLILGDGHLNVFTSITYGKQTIDLPSWVPDWSLRTENDYDLLWQVRHLEEMYHYRASGRTTPRLQCVDNRFLFLDGIKFDIVVRTGNVMNYDIKHPSASGTVFLAWEKLINLDQNLLEDYVGGGTWQIAYWRTLAAALIHFLCESATLKKEPPERVVEMAWESFKVFRWHAGESPVAFADLKSDPWDEYAFTHVLSFCRGIHNRRLFMTRKGYLGIGPRMMETGDSIFVLAGGRTPFLMRRGEVMLANRNCKGYELVGDAYVHGIMFGEAMKSIERGTEPISKYLLF